MLFEQRVMIVELQDPVLPVDSPSYVGLFEDAGGPGSVVNYHIHDPARGKWERGLGTLLGGGVLQRTTVVENHAGSASKVSFDKGPHDLFAWTSPGPAVQTYTPTWGSTGTAPALGNGTIAARYVQTGKLVHVAIALTMGSTTTYGTGHWQFTLPVPAGQDTVFPQGAGLAYDTSATTSYVLAAQVNPTTDLIELFPNAAATPVAAAAPFTWANTDLLRFCATYFAV